MKRHRLLLFAYIVFSIICLVARFFNEFDNWNYVVSAVALSSAFLAYADFFYVHSKFYSDCCDMAEKFISVRSKRIEKEKSITEDICEKVAELKSEGIDVTQEEECFETAKCGFSEVEKVILQYLLRESKDLY